MSWFAREYRVYRSCPDNMRLLLAANMIFAFVMPVIDIFVAAYVMRNTRDVSMVVGLQLAIYTGIPLTFLLNGYLLERFGSQHLYGVGMLLSGASVAAMMWLQNVTLAGILATGLCLGAATGLFAANRILLALSATTDLNRNYYYGFELFFYTVASVVAPLAVGWLIEDTARLGWFGGERNSAYRIVAAAVWALSVVSALVVGRGAFGRMRQSGFLYLRFHPLWRKMLILALLKGLAQGYIVTAPAMLVLLLVGQEGTLGTVLAAGGVLSACILYAVGRTAGARRRMHVFTAGLALFALGALVNALLFSAAGVLVFLLCLLLARPLLDLAYFPIQMLVIDTLAEIEGRSAFGYILNHEFGLYVGRLLGCGLFLALAAFVSNIFALKYALPVIGALQLFSIFAARGALAEANSALRETAPAASRTAAVPSAG
ncbi:MAG TPA: hypothetical protein VHA11_14885 [Bryobacteraceae bacterium]|nr:hypothetical protein [Bryobacteraceae bacterium]